jgi:N-acyl amino acid synthase of PEP-CTERM/exosortase system
MVPAYSDALKNEVYKLRYQVYCIETGFEKPELYPDGIEFDEYDSQSFHYLKLMRQPRGLFFQTRITMKDYFQLKNIPRLITLNS